jgi:hypothetical protein
MATIPFPPQTLTDDDERTIDRFLRACGAYSYRPGRDREPYLALFDRAQRARGRIGKRHGMYFVADARGRELLRARRLDEILKLLAE